MDEVFDPVAYAKEMSERRRIKNNDTSDLDRYTPEELALFEPANNNVGNRDWLETTRSAVAAAQPKPKPFIQDPTKPKHLQQAQAAQGVAHLGNVASALFGSFIGLPSGESVPNLDTTQYYRTQEQVAKQNQKIAKDNEQLQARNIKEQNKAVEKLQQSMQKTINGNDKQVTVRPNYREANIGGRIIKYDSNRFTDETVSDIFNKFFDISELDYRPTASEKREILLRYSLANDDLKNEIEKFGVEPSEEYMDSTPYIPIKQPLFRNDAERFMNKFKRK